MASIHVCSLFQRWPNWYALYAEFHNYKLCGEQPDLFGRDASLDLPEMFHIHLANNAETQARWRRRTCSFHRTHLVGKPEDDYWLLYAFDNLHERYLLLTVVGPNAHSRTEWGSYLRMLSHEIAPPWLLGRKEYPEPA